MNICSMKALMSLLIPAIALIESKGQSLIHNSDSFFSKTLAPVSVYAVKGKTPQKTYQLKSADWVQHDASQVLLQIVGFNAIRKSGNFGFDPVFRGFKWEQINLITDGAMGAHQACPNRMDPPSSQVMINQIKEIELYKGPHNFRYGPSTGAVINFKMNDPVFSAKSIWNGRVGGGYETNGNIRRTEAYINRSSKRWQTALAFSYSAGDDYKDGNDSIIPAVFNRTAINFTTAYLVKTGAIASINITRNFTRNTSFPTLMMDLLSDDTWMIQAKYQVTATNKWFTQWNTQAYASLVDHQMGNGLRPSAATMLSHVFANTETTGGRTELVFRKNNSVWYLGADLKYEYANGTRSRKMMTGMMTGKVFYDTLWQQGSIFRTSAFAHLEKKLGQFQLTASGRVDLVHSKPNQPAAKTIANNALITANDFNTSLSAGISWTFGKHVQMAIWLGHGVRSASITEKFIHYLPVGLDAYEVVGNAQLKPEANTQLDFLVRYQTEKSLLQINFYRAMISQYITTVVDPNLKPIIATSPGVRKYINVEEASMVGFEISYAQQIGRLFNQDISLAYVRGQNRVLQEPLPEINPFELRYKLVAQLLNTKLQPYFNLRHSFAQNRVSTSFNEKATEDFMVVDIGVKVLANKKLQITTAVNNLFDIAYREHLSRFIRPTLPLNAVGRTWVLMLTHQL